MLVKVEMKYLAAIMYHLGYIDGIIGLLSDMSSEQADEILMNIQQARTHIEQVRDLVNDINDNVAPKFGE